MHFSLTDRFLMGVAPALPILFSVTESCSFIVGIFVRSPAVMEHTHKPVNVGVFLPPVSVSVCQVTHRLLARPLHITHTNTSKSSPQNIRSQHDVQK